MVFQADQISQKAQEAKKAPSPRSTTFVQPRPSHGTKELMNGKRTNCPITSTKTLNTKYASSRARPVGVGSRYSTFMARMLSTRHRQLSVGSRCRWRTNIDIPSQNWSACIAFDQWIWREHRHRGKRLVWVEPSCCCTDPGPTRQ